jgi:hypothetical protein
MGANGDRGFTAGQLKYIASGLNFQGEGGFNLMDVFIEPPAEVG